MIFQVIRLTVSALALLGVGWLVARLGLGADVRLKDEQVACELARAAVCGFEPVDLALDRAGIGALLRGADGRVMLLRRHGAQFASRILDDHSFARLNLNFLTIATPEQAFGQITLDLGDQAQVWASSLRQMGK